MANPKIVLGYLLAPLTIPAAYFVPLLLIYQGLPFGVSGAVLFSLNFYPFGLFILLLGNLLVKRRAEPVPKWLAILLFSVIGFCSGMGYQLLVRGNELNDALLSSLFLMMSSCVMYVIYRRLISFRTLAQSSR